MKVRWWIDTRDKPGVLWAFLEHHAGNATAAFEGELSALHLHDIPGAAAEETAALRRQTRSPRQDFVTVPVTPNTIRMLKQRLALPSLFYEGEGLVHVQVEHSSQLVFLAGDHFHRECVSAFSPTPEELLERLLTAGVIRAYRSEARSTEGRRPTGDGVGAPERK